MKENIFHQHVGGTRRKDRRFIDKSPAPEIRRLIVSIRLKTGLNNGDIAKNLGISGSTLANAAGGRAGTVIREDGKSTTQVIVDGLRELLSFR